MSKVKLVAHHGVRIWITNTIMLIFPELDRVEDLEDYREYRMSQYVPGGGVFWVTRKERDSADYIPY